MNNENRPMVVRPEFIRPRKGQQLFDIWNPYYTATIGPVFPDTGHLPLGGRSGEEKLARFGQFMNGMESRANEWRFAGRLALAVQHRLRAEVPLAEDGETVIALPRRDFTPQQNELAQESTVKIALAAFDERDNYIFFDRFDARIDLPAFRKNTAGGGAELIQEQKAAHDAFVAVKCTYGPDHQELTSDLRSVEMLLSPQSLGLHRV